MPKKLRILFFVLLGLVYLSAVRVDTMDVDASQYAEMSMGVMRTGDYLHFYDRGNNYLDKPPFLFWVNALSMKAFGVNNFAEKLPSILFAFWAIFATYQLASCWYSERAAMLSALVLAVCQGMFLMTNDVRCDTILMSWVVTAIWLIARWTTTKRLWYLMGGATAIAFGMMTKGPIALMVPVFCFSAHWALSRDWRSFARPQYLLALLWIAVLLLPMSIGLYQQYDLHPEKKISGLRFFYWSQSFGRITGESPWKNGADMSFLLLNMLWSFLPWIFIFLAALFFRVKALVRQRFRLAAGQEWVTTGGFILAYLSLGSSGYQLPHYIFVAFPLAAVVTGTFIDDLLTGVLPERLKRFFAAFQSVLLVLLTITTGILISWAFPAGTLHLLLFGVLGLGLVLLLFVRLPDRAFVRLVIVPAWGMLFINFFLTNHVYRPLLQYQAGSVAGRYVYSHQVPTNRLLVYKMHDAMVALHFYARAYIPETDTFAAIREKDYLLTTDEGLADMAANKRSYSIVYKDKLFKVSELTPEFINPKTREHELRNYYLIKLEN